MKYIWMVLLATLLFVGCSESNREADWTILVYMAADNGLNDSAISDINEMENAQFSNAVDIIVQIDNNSYNNPSSAFRYKIRPDNSPEITSPKIKSLGEIDSGSPDQLIEFANWGFREYPSLHRALIIWSHGNGWYDLAAQFCPDAESESSISLPAGELQFALKNINFDLDILLLDACNMMTMEVLAETSPYADYVVASEEAVCADGFPYDDIFSDWENYQSSAIIATKISDLFLESYLPGGSQNDSDIYLSVSCATMESKQYAVLIDSWEEFSLNWASEAGSDHFQAAREQAYEFNDLDIDVDIKQYLTLLKEQDISANLNDEIDLILLQIDNAFINSRFIDYPVDNIGTAVIWFPDQEVLFNNLRSQYQQLRFAETGWLNFLDQSFN